MQLDRAPTTGSGLLHGSKVLIVDDDLDALTLYATLLARVGADVRVAKNAETALAILCIWHPDVMLCDLCLPGADGFELFEGIRADARFDDMPAIAISAGPPAIARERCKRAGFVRHVAKPSRLAEIVEAIRCALDSDSTQPSRHCGQVGGATLAE